LLVAAAWGQIGNPEEGELPPLEAVTRLSWLRRL
jgi:hypothetical protein